VDTLSLDVNAAERASVSVAPFALDTELAGV
jgi:hypothetical protein